MLHVTLIAVIGSLVGGSVEQVAARAGVDVPTPKRTHYVEAQYPPRARQVPDLMGIVILEIRVDEKGLPVGIKVTRPIPWLDDAAVEAVKQWRYEPTIVEGSPKQVVVEEIVDMFPDRDSRAHFWADRVKNPKLEKPLRILAAERLAATGVAKKFVLEALSKAAGDSDPEVSDSSKHALQVLSDP